MLKTLFVFPRVMTVEKCPLDGKKELLTRRRGGRFHRTNKLARFKHKNNIQLYPETQTQYVSNTGLKTEHLIGRRTQRNNNLISLPLTNQSHNVLTRRTSFFAIVLYRFVYNSSRNMSR